MNIVFAVRKFILVIVIIFVWNVSTPMLCLAEIVGLLLNLIIFWSEAGVCYEKKEGDQWIEGRVIGKCFKNYKKIPFIEGFKFLFIAEDNT